MGRPKAALAWHGSTLLAHITGVVRRAVDGPVFVVRAPGQELPELDRSVLVIDDAREGLGPMQGLAVGLDMAAAHADVAFVCSTDLPFLHSAFVRAVLTAFGDEDDVVLPHVHGFRQPLAAGYRTALAPVVEKQIALGRMRPAHLFEECRVRVLDEVTLKADRVLAAVDPDLDSVVNVNDPEAYEAALHRPAPEVVVERYGVLATRGSERGRRVIRAATVDEAAARVGLAFDGHLLAAVNGDQIRPDGSMPLLAGDTVSFISADAGG